MEDLNGFLSTGVPPKLGVKRCTPKATFLCGLVQKSGHCSAIPP